MLDPKIIRKDSDRVRGSLKKRASDFDLDSYLEIDKKNRDLISAVEELRSSKNAINKSIAILIFQMKKDLISFLRLDRSIKN